MAAMPMYGKNLKNILLQNQLTDGLETWGVASSIQVLQRYLNYDLDPFYAYVKFGHYGFCMGKVKLFLEPVAALGLKDGLIIQLNELTKLNECQRSRFHSLTLAKDYSDFRIKTFFPETIR